MIFAMTNAVQDRIKRDSLKGSGRRFSVLTREEAKEEAFSLLLQQAADLNNTPVHKLEDWLLTEDGLEQPLYKIQPETSDPRTFMELDQVFVHLRKWEGRNILYFVHKATALTIAFQLGSHKLTNGHSSLVEVFYAGLRRLGYSAEALKEYFINSPLSAFTTSGDASDRSWMTSIIREYYSWMPAEPVGKRLLELSNFIFNDKGNYLRRRDVFWRRPPVDMFNEFLYEATGLKVKRSIPALRIRVRLLGPKEAAQAEYGDTGEAFTRIDKELLPWRSFLIPSRVCFEDLSETIMACFGLLNYHWTKYYLRPNADSQVKTVFILEAQNIEENIFMEKYILRDQLEELMPTFLNQHKTSINLLYEYRDMKQYWQYDFGDNFWFEIESVEESSLDYFKVEYLDGSGDGPPTDVGGYSGLAEFHDALKDPSNEDNAYYIRSAVQAVYWQPYDAEIIRNYLEQVNPLGWSSVYSFQYWAESRDTDKILQELNVSPE